MINIKQAYYGSFSGYYDYTILAASKGLDDAVLHRIKEHSNVGGDIQIADNPEPIYSFYPLDKLKKKWAFSKTTFLGMDRRGNDYLAHILILDSELLDKFRWNVFLLEEKFDARKPQKPENYSNLPNMQNYLQLQDIEIDIEKLEKESLAPLLSGIKDIPVYKVSHILEKLSAPSQNLLVKTVGRRQNNNICRSVFSLLPPDDKKNFSFCSCYSHERNLYYRLIFYSQAEQPIIDRYVTGICIEIDKKSFAKQQNNFYTWILAAKRGLNPISGISILLNTAINVKIAWISLKDEDRQFLKENGIDFFSEITEEVNRYYRQAAGHPMNKELNMPLPPTPELLYSAAENALKKDTEIDNLINYYQKIPGNYDIVSSKEALSEKDKNIVLFMQIVFCISKPDKHFKLIYNEKEDAAFLSSPQKAAQWIKWLYNASTSKKFVLSLLIKWFEIWSIKENNCIDEISEIIQKLIELCWQDSDSVIARTFIAALEQAAPQDKHGDRQQWFSELICKIRPAAKGYFKIFQTIRIVFGENILKVLNENTLKELMPHFIEKSPDKLQAYSKDEYDESVYRIIFQTFIQTLKNKTNYNKAHWELILNVSEKACEFSNDSVLNYLAYLMWFSVKKEPAYCKAVFNNMEKLDIILHRLLLNSHGKNIVMTLQAVFSLSFSKRLKLKLPEKDFCKFEKKFKEYIENSELYHSQRLGYIRQFQHCKKVLLSF